MNKLLINIISLVFFATSCSEEFAPEKLNNSEKSKIERLTMLYKANGWYIDDDASDNELTAFLLKVDEKEFESTISLFKTDVIELSRAENRNMPVKNYSINGKPACAIYGEHHSTLATSSTAMEIIYCIGDMAYVNKTKADITPNAKWYQESGLEYFRWNGIECRLVVSGYIKYGAIKRDMIMCGYIKCDKQKDLISRGYVESFH